MVNTCAVVVTYNRKYVLAECLNSILNGDEVPDRILVVDNASTDGTPEFIEAGYPSGVSVLRLAKNVGGAGGFKAGISEALRLGAKFVWVMDDDHVVQKGALRELMNAMSRTGSDVVGPVMLAPTRDGRLSWPMGPGGVGHHDLESLIREYGPNGYVPQYPATFNAVLYRSSVFETLGLPDERLFIRGDEIEYGLRMERQGTKALAAIKARVYHPAAANEYFPVLSLGPLRLLAYYTGNKLKDYCIFRNRAFYFKKHRRYKSLLLDPPRYLLFFLMTRRLDLKGFRFWLRSYIHGLLGQFGHERQFIT
jgi:rhamnopyranosyl-N-acetylglucosaminyl-diphospho-decaprenol beta-1,3/1,4-galactofuranosyltransferase